LPRVTATDSERYWDERARENALFFVDNEIGYDQPDTAAFWSRGEQVVERMLGMADVVVGADDTVLDIGCGVGRLTRALSSRAGHVYGLDVSREMLELAKRHNPELDNVEWLHGDGAGLGSLDDASVDGCFSHVVFQHIPDPDITLNYVRDMGRVLRPGGWALFQVSTDPSVHRKPARMRERVKSLLRLGGATDEDRAWWGSAVRMDDLRAAADGSALQVEQVFDEGSQYTTVFARRRPVES
jgi:SAM-dependent methyltransferase